MAISLTAFDARGFGRAAVMAATAMVLAWAVMMGTDGEPLWSGVRLARLGALAPVLGALGSQLAAVQARRRGETAALESLGVHPLRVQAGALSAAALVGCVGALWVMSNAAQLQGLFPHVERSDWQMLPDGSWASATLGLSAGPAGLIGHPSLAAGATPQPAAAAVLVAIAAASVVVPVWLQSKPSIAEKLGVGALVLLGEVALFHLAGAGRTSAWALLAAPAVLAVHWVVRNAELWRVRRAQEAG